MKRFKLDHFSKEPSARELAEAINEVFARMAEVEEELDLLAYGSMSAAPHPMLVACTCDADYTGLPHTNVCALKGQS